MASRRRLWIQPLIGAVLGIVLSLLLGPTAPRPGPVTGDPGLAEEAQAVLAPPEGYGDVSVLRVHGGEAEWAGFSEGKVTPETPFELGSITKTFNGLLLADAASQADVSLDDPVAQHLPELRDVPAGEVTLEELASHRAGLPSMAGINMGRTALEDLVGVELTAYAATTSELLDATVDIQLSGRGTYAYSNLGAALLGHALARAGGAATWEEYVTYRLLQPLGMNDTRVIGPGENEPELATPHLAGGRAVQSWTGDGYAPAGVGVVTTAADLEKYLRALLDGTAPGMSALEPHWETSGPTAGMARTGLAWLVSGSSGTEVAWHNGGTGGTRTAIALDRSAGSAAAVLNGSRTDVTGAALQLVGVEGGPPRWAGITERDLYWVVGPLAVLAFLSCALRGRSRLPLLGALLGGLGGVLLLWLAGPWNWVPGWVFGLTAGVFAGGLAVAALRWRELAWWPGRRRWPAVVGTVLGGGFLALMLVAAGWVVVAI